MARWYRRDHADCARAISSTVPRAPVPFGASGRAIVHCVTLSSSRYIKGHHHLYGMLSVVLRLLDICASCSLNKRSWFIWVVWLCLCLYAIGVTLKNVSIGKNKISCHRRKTCLEGNISILIIYFRLTQSSQ